MSAREELVGHAVTTRTVTLDSVEPLLDAYRAEVLREAAALLRREGRDRISGIGRIYYRHAADLIDPDKS